MKNVKEKFDTVTEGIQMINEKLDRYTEEKRREHEKFEMGLLECRRHLNEHRTNIEFHRGRRAKRSLDLGVHHPLFAVHPY